jgi:hypothetical protein
VTSRAGQLVADFFFGLSALDAPREFAALGARQQTPRAQTLEDHHDRYRLVAGEGLVRRAQGGLRENPLVRITLAPVDHLHSRPASHEVLVTLIVTPVQQRGGRDH